MIDEDRDSLSLPPDARPAEAQPQWRQDFPVDVPQDNYIARREFTKFLVLTSLAFVVSSRWRRSAVDRGARPTVARWRAPQPAPSFPADGASADRAPR